MRRARWAGALAAVALAVSACGGSDGSNGGGSDLQDVVDDPSIAPGTPEEGAPDGPLTDGETPSPEEDVVLPERDTEQS